MRRIRLSTIYTFTFATLIAVTFAVGLSGCFALSKRDDAEEAKNAAALERSRLFSSTLEPGSSLSRSAGEVMYVRLKTIWPLIPDTAERDYTWFGGSGPFASVGKPERPSGAVPIIALRNQIASYCRGNNLASNSNFAFAGAEKLLTTASTPQVVNSMAAPTGPIPVLMPGEAYPSSEPTRLAFIAARRVWLYPYAADSAEVTALADLYSTSLGFNLPGQSGVAGSTVTSSSTAPSSVVDEAKISLCVAAFMAPQFWVGNPGPADAIRRIALELGRRAPTFDEFSRYLKGTLTIDAYTRQIQQEPRYMAAVKSWHADWLGLREFHAAQQDYRSTAGYVASPLSGIIFQSTRSNASEVHKLILSRRSVDVINNSEDCTGVDNQPFDPRTTALLWEHFNIGTNRWETAGAWVRREYAEQFYLNATIASSESSKAANAASLFTEYCTPFIDPSWNPSNGEAVNPTAEWYKCDGQIWDTISGTAKRVGVEDINQAVKTDANYHYAQTFPHSGLYESSPDVPRTNRLYGTSAAGWVMQASVATDVGFSGSQRRLRRFAPLGEQNGSSRVSSWYSGEPMKVCNALTRFWATCTYRPEDPRFLKLGRNLDWQAMRAYPITTWYDPIVDSMAHPAVIKHLRCGNASFASNLSEDAAFPLGYDPATLSPRPRTAVEADQNQINQIASNPKYTPYRTRSSDSPVDLEYRAHLQLAEDMQNEPYYLLESILSVPNDQDDYRLMLTADYTFARKELELYYRTQSFIIPAIPSDYSSAHYSGPTALLRPYKTFFTSDFSRTTAFAEQPSLFRKIYPGQFQPIPLRLLHNRIYEMHTLDAGSPATAKAVRGAVYSLDPALLDDVDHPGNPQHLQPRVTSGLLTMPAFLVPQATKMRSISARIFRRLLCGEPDLYAPARGSTEYNIQLANATTRETSAAAHLDPEKSCIVCHLNMDPVAKIYSGNFATNVGRNEVLAMAGELFRANLWDGNQPAYGTIGGGQKGRGAVLGQEVEGIEKLGRVLSESDQFNSCVVQTTFHNIFGRKPNFSDVKMINAVQARFKLHHSYNRMVRELVNNPIFTGEE